MWTLAGWRDWILADGTLRWPDSEIGLWLTGHFVSRVDWPGGVARCWFNGGVGPHVIPPGGKIERPRSIGMISLLSSF